MSNRNWFTTKLLIVTEKPIDIFYKDKHIGTFITEELIGDGSTGEHIKSSWHIYAEGTFDIEMDEDEALAVQNVGDAIDFIAKYVD